MAHAISTRTPAHIPAPQHKYESSDHDRLVEVTTKLDALLAFSYGESGEAFRNLNGDIQDAYLWTCSDMARQALDLAKRLEAAP